MYSKRKERKFITKILELSYTLGLKHIFDYYTVNKPKTKLESSNSQLFLKKKRKKEIVKHLHNNLHLHLFRQHSTFG